MFLLRQEDSEDLLRQMQADVTMQQKPWARRNIEEEQ